MWTNDLELNLDPDVQCGPSSRTPQEMVSPHGGWSSVYAMHSRFDCRSLESDSEIAQCCPSSRTPQETVSPHGGWSSVYAMHRSPPDVRGLSRCSSEVLQHLSTHVDVPSPQTPQETLSPQVNGAPFSCGWTVGLNLGLGTTASTAFKSSSR